MHLSKIYCKEGFKGIIVSAYITFCPRKSLGGYSTVYAQQQIWTIHINDFICPSSAAREDLGKAVKIWIYNREI